MRPSRTSLLIVLIAVVALPAGAQPPDCGPDCLGLYFTLLHSRTSCLPGVPAGNAEAYLTLTSPTMDAVSFMSFAVVAEGPVIVSGVNFGGTQICEPIEPGAVCHLWDPPLATGTEVELAVIGLFYFGGGAPAYVGVRTAGLTMDDPVWIVTGDGADAALNRSTGPGQFLAQMGGDCGIVPVTTRSWGAVKSLYR